MPDPDLCASCGNRFPSGQLCESCRPPDKALPGQLAVFGGVDGLTMFLGLVAGIVIAQQSSAAAWHAALGGAMGEFVGMTSGQYMSDRASGVHAALACGISGAIACGAPGVPFIFLARAAAVIVALVIAVIIGAAVAWLRPEKGWQAAAQTYSVLITAGILSGLTGLI